MGDDTLIHSFSGDYYLAELFYFADVILFTFSIIRHGHKAAFANEFVKKIMIKLNMQTFGLFNMIYLTHDLQYLYNIIR